LGQTTSSVNGANAAIAIERWCLGEARAEAEDRTYNPFEEDDSATARSVKQFIADKEREEDAEKGEK